jgi:CRP-like cAMP-binding protein
MGTKRSLNRVYMQIAGRGFAAPIEACRNEFVSNDRFRDLMLRYVQTQLIQAMQSAGCNLSHHLEQRLARWLLLCADRSRTDSFVLSQEFLGMMLGVRRTSVNVALGRLADKAFIENHRNRITIINKTALEGQACECYSVVKHHLDSFTEFDSGQGDR